MKNIYYYVLGIIILISAQASATIHVIQIGNNFFSPLKTTIAHGDTVRWIWDGGLMHSTTSDVGSAKIWNSGTTSAPGFTFDVVFTVADGSGPFPYLCSVHFITMKDTIFVGFTDNDDDGYASDIDCDDNDPNINPGAIEIANDGIDQDCDGNDGILCYPDNDNDGYGDAGHNGVVEAGACPVNSVENNSDCSDGDPNINPGAEDIPDDGIDQNCDGVDASGCCIDMRGNVDNDPLDSVDIGDIVYMVEFQFNDGPVPFCDDESDVDISGGLDIGDIVFLVEYQFNSGPPPGSCL